MKKLIICFFIFLIACQSSDRRYEGKTIFRYNLEEGITSLDPAFARSLDNVSAVNQLFNGLVQTDEKLQIKPCIAKSWEILDSGKTYRFTLRNDVFFHKAPCFGTDSTRKVIADDFVYSFARLIDSKVLSPGKWVMNEVARKNDGALAIHAINDSILEIHLNRSFQPFLGILSMQYCSVIPKEAIDYFAADFRANPIGTGPFEFKYWKENGKLIFLKNQHYFERDEAGEHLPYLDAIAISFTKDQEVTFLKFLNGDLDYLSGLKGTYKDELLDTRGKLREKYHAKIRFETAPYLNSEYLGFMVDPNLLPENHPILNPLVRKAINYGFDRQKMLTYLRNGIGTPASQGFVPLGLPSFDTSFVGYSFQPDSTLSLLERAGYPNGKGLPLIELSTAAQYLDICEYLQSQLANFGIRIKVEVNQAATNNELIAKGEAVFFRKSWVADYPDAENYLSLFTTFNFSPKGPNYTHYSNPVYDRFYQKAINTDSDSMRYVYYRQMDSIIIADAPIVPLFYDRVVRFYQPTISGIGLNPMNLLVLKYAKKETN